MMKLRYMMLAVTVLFSYGTLSYAAKKSMDHDELKSFYVHSEKHDHQSSHEDNKYDFKDHIKELLKNHHDNHNVFLKLCKNEKDDHDSEHNDNQGPSGEDGNIGGGNNQVPVPAAFWLFGSSLIGLLGFKRKGL